MLEWGGGVTQPVVCGAGVGQLLQLLLAVPRTVHSSTACTQWLLTTWGGGVICVCTLLGLLQLNAQ